MQSSFSYLFLFPQLSVIALAVVVIGVLLSGDGAAAPLVQIFLTQVVALGGLLVGQAPLLGNAGQLVNAVDFCLFQKRAVLRLSFSESAGARGCGRPGR